MSILDKDSAMEDHWSDNPRHQGEHMSKESMKLALEALEGVWKGGFSFPDVDQIREAIIALRAALAEQPAQQNVVAWESDRGEIYYDKEDAFRYSDGFIRPLVYGDTPPAGRWARHKVYARNIEAKLKEKNT